MTPAELREAAREWREKPRGSRSPFTPWDAAIADSLEAAAAEIERLQAENSMLRNWYNTVEDALGDSDGR